ncbi:MULTISPECIES: competence protein ComJ [Agrobacterium]|uniref:Competence protein ComJ n=1 Tax=Agrobacterium rosae TaxID=1972867 RepID=A0AAW9FH29_9HYPH|nr:MULTISPECIES: competence protein ComJ [Agrobacterium]MDX8302275.1 competence protein ComJ [Agrobacterium rosae]SCX19021.1 Competence protein J (ComJ) [Agrobacterium sp. DSM 25558]
MIEEFPLTVLYTQVVVHLPNLPRPGLLWDDAHVDQGFAWSEGIVSFGVPDHDGECLIRIDVADAVKVEADAEWAVQTPFDASVSPLKIGTIANMRDVAVPNGLYNLVFQALPGSVIPEAEFAFLLLLTFVPATSPSFEILKQGEELATDTVLRRDAERAS